MNRWFRRLKGAVTLGAFWGAASGVVAAACNGLLQLLGGGIALDALLLTGLQFGIVGWVVGSTFAGALIDFEARGLLGRMKSWRIAVWGAVMGGALVPIVLLMTGGSSLLQGIALAGLVGLGAAVGSVLSVGTLRLAESVSRELAAGSATGHIGTGTDQVDTSIGPARRPE